MMNLLQQMQRSLQLLLILLRRSGSTSSISDRKIHYFKGIVAEAGITEAEELQIKEYINIKNLLSFGGISK